MKQFFLTIAAVFVGLMLFFVGLPIMLITSAAMSAPKSSVPRAAVIELDLREGVSDQDPQNPFALFGGAGLSVMRVVETLDRAEDDDRVKALFVRLPEGGMTPAAADELRQAFRRFRAAGKPVIVHSQGLYPAGAVVSTYMLGAAGSEFWLQGNASLQATGLATEELFFGRAFERYGVQAEFEQRYEYKNAVNPFMQADFTEPHREATLSWMNAVYESAVANAARDRRVEPAALREALEAGPHTAEQARARRLVDRLGQVEEARAHALERAGARGRIIEFDDYADDAGRRARGRGPVIAVVGGEGAIVTGAGSADPFGSESTMYSDDIAEAIYDAIEDDDVRAIVFRVSSPGGSDVASEQILAAVRAAKAAGKPVVVSMGAYAASGGYWISSEASHIVAQPTTLTGSIGVFGGKFVLREALGRFGVDMRGLSVGGEYADAFASSQPFSPADRRAFSSWMDTIYESFISRVATGRRLAPERVREIARGRVWTGAQARELGLVDELGGFHEAVNRAKALAEIEADTEVRLRRFPGAKSPWEAFSEMFGVSAQSARVLMGVGAVMDDPDARALMARARTERMRGEGAAVLADQPLN